MINLLKMPRKTSKNTKKSSSADKMTSAQKDFIKQQQQLTQQVTQLTKEMQRLHKLEFLKIFKHPFKFIGIALVKGIMVGFGSVLGATVVVAIFIYILSKISFVPIVGEFIQDIIDEVKSDQTTEESVEENQPSNQ